MWLVPSSAARSVRPTGETLGRRRSVRAVAAWLRPLAEDDLDAMHRIFGDPACMRYWHRQVSTSIDDTARIVQELLGRGHGTWAIGDDADPSDALGFVSFVRTPTRGALVGFGYAIRKDAWGRGITVDACRQALAHGFDEIEIAGVELWIHAHNRQSRRVAEKLGATVRSQTLLGYETGATPAVVYGLLRDTWHGADVDVPTVHAIEPVLPVSDLTAAVEWWCDLLGFAVAFTVGDPPRLVKVVPAPGFAGTPGVQLRAATDEDVTAGCVGTTTLSLTAGVDLEAQAQRAVAYGATVCTPYGRRPWGMLEIELADPDGNRIRLASP